MHIATLSMVLTPELNCAETDVVKPLRLLALPHRVCVGVDMRAMNLVNNARVIANVGG